MHESDVQALLDTVAAELDAAVALDDVELRLLGHTAHDNAIDDVRRASIMGRRVSPQLRSHLEHCEIQRADGPVRVRADAAFGMLDRWCIPVRFRGILLGYVWVLDARGIPEDRLGGAIEAANQIGALLYRRRLVSQLDTDLLRLLLIPNPENEAAAADARAVATYTYNGPIAVVVAGAANCDEFNSAARDDLAHALRAAGGHTSPEGLLTGVISDLGVLIAPLRTFDDLSPAQALAESARRIAFRQNDSLDVVVAVGGATGLERASRSYAEARRTLNMMRVMPDLRPIAAWNDLGVFRALSLVPPDEAESGVIDKRVRHLLTDKALFVTAEAFLDLAGDVQRTAARLYIHRTTLYQRLDRINTLYGLDLRRNGDHRLITHLGLKLARMVSLSPSS